MIVNKKTDEIHSDAANKKNHPQVRIKIFKELPQSEG